MTVQQPRLEINGSDEENTMKNVKTILVTGGAGFIGGWFVRHLLQVYGTKYTVLCFDILDYCASKRNFQPVEHLPNFHFFPGDLCDRDRVTALFQQFKVDAVVHFAANSHVDQSLVNPLSFTRSNVTGTHVLLEAARQAGTVIRFIHISTDEVYGGNMPGQDYAFTEEDQLNPTNPYSASKAAAEMIANSYRYSFHMPIIITRCNNVFGPCQYPEKLIPKFAMQMLRSQRMTLHGQGEAVRGFVYVSDAMSAFDIILHRGLVSETYNISSKEQIKSDTCEQYLETVADRPFNDRMYWTNDSKLRQLGWTEKVSFDEGLIMTLEWYRDHGETFWSGPGPACKLNGRQG
nr:NAD dependent epimerase/dehydratase [Aspergillus niger CBS 513.88]|eukprot:XP_001397332.2 NAD dependent epimerase/dehydratase [Aspergillus niger CBS 513.88]